MLILNSNGEVRAAHFERPDDSWHALTNKLDQAKTPYLFYDPFDAPEYAWLSWSQIDRKTMERLIGGRFEAPDFDKADRAVRAPDLQPPGDFPTTWGVMF